MTDTGHPFSSSAKQFTIWPTGTVNAWDLTAHVNHNHNAFHEAKDGFFGFFESIDDYEVSDALLNMENR